MLKLFYKYCKKNWLLITIVIILLVAQAYLQLLLPDLMSEITTIVQSPSALGSPETYVNPNLTTIAFFMTPTFNRISDVWTVGIAMIIISFLALGMAIFVSLNVSYIGAQFARDLRNDIFKKIETFSQGEYSKFGTATLITRTTNDVEQVQQILMMGLRVVITSPVTLVVAIVMIVGKDANLALILAISIPLIIISVVILLSVANPLFKRIQTVTDKVTLVLRETLTGVRVIRAFDQQDRETKRFDDSNKEMTVITTKVARTMSFADPIITIIFDITYIGIYFYGFILLDGKAFNTTLLSSTMSNVLATAQYAMQIMMAFLMFSFLLIMFPRAQVCGKRINEVLDAKISIVDPATPCENPEIHGEVEFKNVSFIFPEATLPTLVDISFKTKPGSVTAIIGSTGSGKSSIINLIPRFYDVSAGEVLVDGVDVRKYSQKMLRDKIGFVPQTALLFSGTIKDNIKFGKEDATDDEINEAIRVAQAEHFVSKKEKGIDSDCSQGGKNFSGGQKQRLAIARALVKKPEIYVFDDSFSALDFKTDIKLRTALKSYTKNSSVIIVAQRVSTILYADNIIVLNEGKIVGQGTHKELLKTCEVYKEIVFSQLDKDEIQKTMQLGKETLVGEGGEN